MLIIIRPTNSSENAGRDLRLPAMETNLQLGSRRPAFAMRLARVSVFAVVSVAVLALAPRPALAEAEAEAVTGACDALSGYLRDALAGPTPAVPSALSSFHSEYHLLESELEDTLRATAPTSPSAYTARVTPACRAEIRRGAAPAATAAAQAWTQRLERGWIDRGRIVRCAMQDPAALTEVDEWMDSTYRNHPEARAVCASELASWPGAELVFSGILTRSVRRVGREAWEIDMPVVAAANVMGTPELREQLVPVLVAAHMSRAVGYDRLRAAVCTNDGMMSGDRARACSTLPREAESEWRASEPPPPNRWLVRGGATAVYAGLITAALVETKGVRTLPTLAGVLGGGVTGLAVPVCVAAAHDYPRNASDEVLLKALVIPSVVLGGVLGGLAGHAIAASPGARAPVTAIGLAPVYLLTLASSFD
jgi:hypothetical protein